MTGGKEVKSVKVLSTSKAISSDESVTPGVTTNVIRTESDEIIYVLNGRIVPYSEILSMSTSKLDSMTVIKDKENHDFKKFADEYIKTSQIAPTCVILITTKK